MHDIPLEELKGNPSAIHNTVHKKKMRKMMLDGDRPSECFQCWNVEDEGPERISERVFKTLMFEDEDLDAIPTKPWDDNTFLRTLEVSFDRACNFKCSYCNPAFSTAWVKDIKDNGPYENLQSDGRGHFIDTAPWAENVAKRDEDNPYIQAFWEWWEEKGGLSDTLDAIRVTGGEPIMHPGVWKLFRWFKDNPERGKKIRVAINSNLVPEKEKTFTKLIEAIQYLPDFEMFASCESTGEQSNYIRDGMDYEVWLNNAKRLLDEPKVQRFYSMMTINSLCLGTITDFMDDILSLREIYGVERSPMLSLNLVLYPEFQSIPTLPTYIIEHYNDKLKAWYDKRKGDLRPIEDVHVMRVIEFMDKAIKSPPAETDLRKRRNDFKSFYTQYDERRGKDFRATFDPIIVDWYDTLTVETSSIRERGADPSSIEIFEVTK
jgi:organic radical activating enzyme